MSGLLKARLRESPQPDSGLERQAASLRLEGYGKVKMTHQGFALSLFISSMPHTTPQRYGPVRLPIKNVQLSGLSQTACYAGGDFLNPEP